MFESFLDLSTPRMARPLCLHCTARWLWILELHSSQYHEPNSRLRQEIAVDFGLLAGLVGEEVVLPLCENLDVLNAVHPHTFLCVCSRLAYHFAIIIYSHSESDRNGADFDARR
jgi:hypothetical protein